MPELTATQTVPDPTTATADDSHGVVLIRAGYGATGLWLPNGSPDDGFRPAAGVTVTATPSTTSPIVDLDRRAVIVPQPVSATTNEAGVAGVRLTATVGAEQVGLRWTVTVGVGRKALTVGQVDVPAGVVVPLWEAVLQSRTPPRGLHWLDDDFRAVGGDTPELVTNEYAAYRGEDPVAIRSAQWLVTAGSVFARSSAAWSGVVDYAAPGPTSETATNSGVFRMRTRSAGYRDHRLTFSIRPVQEQVVADKANFFDGAHVVLRNDWRREHGYYITFLRSDDQVVIKRKYRQLYSTLAQIDHPGVPVGSWSEVSAEAVNVPDGTRITLRIGGKIVLETVDPLQLPAGMMGLRTDNLEWEAKNFRAEIA